MGSMSHLVVEASAHRAAVGFMADVPTCCQYRENLPRSFTLE
jgi:hypothetical protein